MPTYLAGHAARIGHAGVVEALERHGMTLPHYAVLLALVDFGSLAPHELARHLGMRRAHVSTYVENLSQGGLVQRQPNPDDRRSVTVVLTEAGRGLVATLWPETQKAQQRLLRGLSPSEQDTLVMLLTKIVANDEDDPELGERGSAI